MTDSLSVGLMNKRDLKVGVKLPNIIFDLLSKIPDDENKVSDSGFPQLVDDDAKHCFPGQGNQGLGLGVTVGTKLGARPGNGNDRFHVTVSTQSYVFLTSASNHV
jgi:hypothetical protein